MKYPDYSVWLQPEGDAYDEYRKCIEDLAKEHGAPLFEPHVTVLGRIINSEHDAVEQSAKLAAEISEPMIINLIRVTFGEAYFQCVYLQAEKSAALDQLHNRAKKLFSIDGLPNPTYIPHLSLMYGERPLDLRKQITASLPQSLLGSFQTKELQLVDTKGDEQDWHKVAGFALGK